MNWMERKSNDRVLKQIADKRSLIIKIMEGKIKFIGPFIRYNDFLNNIFEERRRMIRIPRGLPRTI